ncbi:hypothetical protein ABZV75_29420 [Streptomyces flaveolus]|uniref:hypothetical protein n=1 Tax=Streptomyces flaveolus TaxID=67297 RepID=UPI0033ACC6B4
MRDRALLRISRSFGVLVLASLAWPALLGGALTRSWPGALTALFRAGLVRVCLVHPVTRCVDSVCHPAGSRPLRSRDRSRNAWWPAPLSFGESCRDLRHADPASARHGVLTGQLDAGARLIRWSERLGPPTAYGGRTRTG